MNTEDIKSMSKDKFRKITKQKSEEKAFEALIYIIYLRRRKAQGPSFRIWKQDSDGRLSLS